MITKQTFIPLLLLVFFLFQCGKKEEKKAEDLRPVKFIKVGSSTQDKTRTFNGVAKAGNEIELSFRNNGIIQKVNVKKGQRVKKGDLIARLDNLEAKLSYEKSISSLNSAESDRNTLKAELERVKTLYEKGSSPLKDYQVAKNNYQNAVSQFESAKRNKDIQQSQINYGIIYAPSDGMIANTMGKVNERVQAGHVFAVLNAGNKMKIGLELPENVINKVQIGMNTEIQFSALNGGTFIGNVIEISPITSGSSATYPVDVEIQNPSSDIRPGMASSVTFNFETTNSDQLEAMVIPIKAVGEDGKGNYVFIIETSDNLTGVAKKTVVQIGDITTDGFEITSGLENGQLIATAGLQTLLDGQKVKLN